MVESRKDFPVPAPPVENIWSGSEVINAELLQQFLMYCRILSGQLLMN